MKINHRATIDATITKAIESGADREVINNIENALENGQDDWNKGPDHQSSENEFDQAVSYMESYLESIDRRDLYVEVKATQ